MSDAMPDRKSYDMNGYRKAIKGAWVAMQNQYAVYQHLLRIGSTKRFAKDPRKWWVLPPDVWPTLAEFELGGGRKEERL